MSKRRIIGATGGAVGLGGVAAGLGACCVTPWAVAIVGVGGAVALARLAVLLPFVLGGIVVLLGFAFYLAYRPLPPCDDGTCDTRRQGRLRWVVWLGTAIVAATLFATYMVNF